MFVCGGLTELNIPKSHLNGFPEVSSIVFIYDVDADKWTQGPNLVSERKDHSSCILGQKIYIFGGR